jgi:hypothetical protein
MKDETIYEILQREHEEVQAILDKLDETESGPVRERLLGKLKAELTAHMHGEEVVVYAALAEQEETREVALAAREEHRAARNVFSELERLTTEGELWGARFHVLKDNIEHHVEEEEGPLLRAARKVWDREAAREIGRLYLEAKQQKLARAS